LKALASMGEEKENKGKDLVDRPAPASPADELPAKGDYDVAVIARRQDGTMI
jgi:hypothetical protein